MVDVVNGLVFPVGHGAHLADRVGTIIENVGKRSCGRHEAFVDTLVDA